MFENLFSKQMSKFYATPSAPVSTSKLFDADVSMDDDGDLSATVVDDLMRSWEKRYCTYSPINIFVGTYNVNGQVPAVNLSPWLTDGLDQPPDMYVLGFQELDLSQQAFLFDSTTREAEWAEVVKRGLHPKEQYIEVKRVRLVGILLLVFAKRERYGDIPQNMVYTQTCPTGLLNRMGNKGGVAVSLRIHDTLLCFVNSHLAAGGDELLRRNQDFREISRITFSGPGRPTIFDHDASVWLGDLNYRLEKLDGRHLDNHEVRKACVNGDCAGLLKFDQLVKMQKSKTAFHDFTEGTISFAPTYKYDPGTDNWDSSEKARVPAWCDRVLYMSRTASVKQLQYRSVRELKISDHKPVVAVLSVMVKKIDKNKYRKVHEEAIREGDRRANEALPAIELVRSEFDFGQVKFLEPKVLTMTIRNVGKYPVFFKFGNRPRENGELAVSNRWLIVTPTSQRIDVGQECVIDLQALVDKESAWTLNAASTSKLNDLLVLHLRNGRDYFVTATADYVPSCYGQSIERLMQSQTPIQDVQLIDLGGPSTIPDNLPVPKELWRLVEDIRRTGLDKPELFGQGGSHNDFIAIREALDTGYPEQLPSCDRDVHSVCEALLRFLDSLPEPVIPAAYHDQCLRVSQTPVACWQVIERTPVAHSETFHYLIQFLREILQHSARNGTKEQELCETFAGLFFRSDQRKQSSLDLADKRKSVVFVQSCLAYDKETTLRSKLYDNRVPNTF